jgi:hypothetical protein
MPSPFRKKQYISSSERTKNLSSRTMTNIANKQLLIDNNLKKYKTINHSQHLNYTKGFFQLQNCNCIDEKSTVRQARQGKYSFIDLDDVVKSKVYDKHCKYKDYYYIVDNCRHQKGLITPLGKVNPAPKDKLFSYPTPITVFNCEETDKKTCGPCDTHCDDANHNHYFPVNSQTVKYTHNHSSKPHPNPHPFPKYNATNFMSKYDLDKSLVGN